MTLRSQLKKAVAAVAAAASLFAVGVSTANALQDGNATFGENSGIYIHKRATTTKSTTEGTGKVQDAAGQGLNGVEFIVYKLDIDLVEGQGKVAALTAADVATVKSKTSGDELATKYSTDGALNFQTVTTANRDYVDQNGATQPAEDGVAKYPVAAKGYYLIVENSKTIAGGESTDGTNYVDGVKYDAAAATVVAMPYASEKTDGTYDYLTNVNIYPKNVQSAEPGKVVKTQLTSKDVTAVTVGPDQIVSKEDVVAYDLKLVFNREDTAGASYIGTDDITQAEIVDNLPTAQVPTATGVEIRSVLTLADTNTEVNLIKSDGTLEVLDAGDYTFTNNSSTQTTTGWTPTMTWSLGQTGLQKVNTKTVGTNFDYKGIQVRVQLKATADLQYASSLVNKSSGIVNSKAQDSDKVESPVAGLNLLKTDSAEQDWSLLSGAKFQLSKIYDQSRETATGVTNKINDVQQSGTNGVLAFGDLAKINNLEQASAASATEPDTPGTFAADNATIADFAGAVANRGSSKWFKFYAYETQAPTGYQLSQFPVTVVLKVSVNANGKVSVEQQDTNVYTGTGKAADAANGETNDAVRVVNYKPGEEKNPFKLPNTGGVGTVLLTLAGVALIVFAVVFLRRRRNEEER